MIIQLSVKDDDGRLMALVEREFADLLLAHVLPKGVGMWTTEARVEKAIRAGIDDALAALRRGA